MGSRFQGANSRIADQVQVAQARQAWQMAELRKDAMMFEQNVIAPLKVREMEIDLDRQQDEAVTSAMQNEVERARLKNRMRNQQQVTGLHQTFINTHPLDRYEHIDEFVNQARTLHEVNRDEESGSLFKNLANYKIQKVLSGNRPLPTQTEKQAGRKSYDKGITVDGQKQIKVNGRFVPATPENIALAEAEISGNEITISKNPGMPAAYRDGAEFGTGTDVQQTTSQTGPGLPEPYQQKYKDRVEELQALRQEFLPYEDLLPQIDNELQREMNRPQYWSKQFEHFTNLPPEAQSIVNKARTGSVISPLERSYVENSVEQMAKGGTGNKRYSPPAPFEAIKDFSKYTPEVQRSLIAQYGQSVFAPQMGQAAAAGQTPVMSDTPKPAPVVADNSVTTSEPTTPQDQPVPEKGFIVEDPERTADPLRTKQILYSFRNNPDLNTSFAEYLKQNADNPIIRGAIALPLVGRYMNVRRGEKAGHKEAAAKRAIEMEISDQAALAQDDYLSGIRKVARTIQEGPEFLASLKGLSPQQVSEKRKETYQQAASELKNSVEFQKWQALKDELAKVRGLETGGENAPSPADKYFR